MQYGAAYLPAITDNLYKQPDRDAAMLFSGEIMNKGQRRFFGTLALCGGFMGFGKALQAVYLSHELIDVEARLVFLMIYAWAIYCGLRTLEGGKNVERLNMWLWLIQIPIFRFQSFGYLLACGFHVSFVWQIESPNITFSWLIGSVFNYTLIHPNGPSLIGINAFAAFMTAWLIYMVYNLHYYGSEPNLSKTHVATDA